MYKLMRSVKHLSATVVMLSAAFVASAQQAIEFEKYTLNGPAEGTEIVEHKGRTALKISGGRFWIDGETFSDGVIEFEVSMPESHTFLGVNLRAGSDVRFEDFYLRAHLDNKPDALQYQPVENRNAAWQIYSDKNFINSADMKFDDWNQVKILVKGDKAEFFVNSDKPNLHVPDLKTDVRSGKIGIWLFSISKKPAFFSNINVRKLKPGEGLIGEPQEGKPLPDGLIKRWQVSSLVAEDQVNKDNHLNINPDSLSWQSLEVEHNGIANLARLASITQKTNTALIKLDIEADKAEVRKLKFGFSDRVQIFLNGNLLYAGNDGWKSRDYRFLGTVGWYDTVGLALKPGDNQVIIAVSESFGGWAWTGAWEE